jgi:uncharacterized repeat protein (TIGR01451 family)
MRSRALPPTRAANGRSRAAYGRRGALLALVALAAVVSSSSSSAFFAGRFLRRALPPAPAQTAAPDAADTPRAGHGLLPWRAPGFAAAPLAPPAPPDPAGETITTYAADCVTPRTTFALGETVCAKVTNAPLGDRPRRRFSWVNSAGYILRLADITTDPQTDSFTLPADAVATLDGQSIDNRGQWAIRTEDTAEISVIAVTYITVRDPDNPAADLAVTNLVRPGAAQVAAGTDVVFETYVTNNGPDTAQGVQLTTDVPAGTSFAAVAQNAGPVFSCSTPGVGSAGTITCAIARLAKGDAAKLVFTYHVDGGATPETVIDSTASVGSTTPDRHTPDNSATGTATVTATPCRLTAPADIKTTAADGESGAYVSYELPATTGDCGQPTVGDEGEPIQPVSCSPESGSFFGIGTTTVTCVSPNSNSASFLVTVESPGDLSITLNGQSPITLECGADFGDPGATATNGAGDSIPVTATVSGSGSIDASTPPGSYTITYTAVDGQHSVSTTRAVNIVDTTPPVISITGGSPLTVSCGKPFVDPGATADDGCAGQVSVSSAGTVDTDTPGTYTITYTATDRNNNTATAERTVIVSSDQPPDITLTGQSTMTIECGSTFSDPGATAAAACVGPVPVSASGSVDTHTPGTYMITYTADNNGHTATATRTVKVVDTTPPVIALNGADTLTVECHTAFVDPGATASDGCAGDVSVTTSGSVDTNTPGSYTLTYTAQDPSGNAAAPVTRTVNVVDTAAPVLALLGANPLLVDLNATFVDPGATASDGCAGDLTSQIVRTGSVDTSVAGTYTLTYTVSDGAGHVVSRTRTVNVGDTTPPTINVNNQTPSLWPANHKYQSFRVTDFVTGVTDNGASLGVGGVVIEKVTSDEAENGPGSGNTTADIVLAADCKSVQLRAEREGNGNGRVYTITFKARDAAGNVGRATSKVVVPRNPGETPVDGGAHYTVNGSCP